VGLQSDVSDNMGHENFMNLAMKIFNYVADHVQNDTE
jgi:hypothetical protein